MRYFSRMAEVNRSINIFLNEAEVAASLEKMQQKAESLRERMEKAAGTEQWEKLKQQLDSTEGKITNLGRQLAGEVNPTLKQMEQTVTKLRNELKNTEVGTEAFVQKTKQLAQAEQALNKVKVQMDGVKKGLDEVQKSSSAFDKLKSSASSLADEIPGLGAAFRLLTNPIAMAVGAFMALGKLLMEFKPIADAVEQGIAGIRAGFSAFVNGGDAVAAAQQMARLTKTLQDLKDAQDNLRIEEAEADATVRRLLLSARDRTKTEEERLALLQRAADIQTEIYAKQRDLMIQNQKAEEQSFLVSKNLKQRDLDILLGQTEQYDYLTAEQIERLKENIESRTTLNDEELEVIRQGRIKIIQLEGQYLNLQEVIENRKNQLLEKTAEQKEKNLDKQEQANKQLLQNEQEYSNMLDMLYSEFLLNERDKIAKFYDDKIALIKGKSEKETEIRLAIEQEKQYALDAYDKKHTAVNEKIVLDTKNAVLETTPVIVKYLNDTVDKVKTKWSEFKDWMSGEWGQALQAGVQAVNNLISGSIAISDNLTEKKLQDIGKVFTKQQEELDRQRELNLISEEAYALKSEAIKKDQARKEAQIKRDQFIKQKAANITMAVINTALSIVNQLATVPGPAGWVMAALAAAAGAVQIGVIASQPVPQFAKGGKLAGPRHDKGGIPVSRNGRIVAEAEGDEWFINRHSSNDYNHVLDAINRDDAQVQWLKGFPRLNMPYAIAGGQLVMGADGLPVAAANNSELKKEMKEARKTHVQAAKYMADRIVKAIETSQPRTRL